MNNTYIVNYGGFLVDFSCAFTAEYKLYLGISIGLLFIVTTFGNSLVLLCICKYRQQFKGSYYILIGNLALTDLLFGVVSILLIADFVFSELEGNVTFCVVRALGVLVTYSSSLFTLLAISVDRFMAVVFPMKHMWQSKMTRVFYGAIILIWCVSFGLTAVFWIIIDSITEQTNVVCRNGAIIPKLIDIGALSALFLQIIINTILYSLIVHRLRTRPFQTPISVAKTKRKTTLMISVSVLFSLCWLPFMVCTIIPYAATHRTESAFCVREYIVVLGYMNSSINWLLYALSNKKLRTSFKVVFVRNVSSGTALNFNCGGLSIEKEK